MAIPSNLIREQYHEAFQQILQQLNSAQKQAVMQTEGPVLALAGPGTGKTHILSARIGQILLSSDIQSYNILCLTFTDAAVHAMRKRLMKFIGPEAHRVHIYTFHSFCNKVIQENLEVFGRHELEPLSDLERIDIIRTILSNLDVEHPLKMDYRNEFYYEKHLTDLFRLMKSERWTPTLLHQKIKAYLDDLPHRAEMHYKRKSGANQKGDLKTALFNKKVAQMTKLKAAIELFEQYELALAQKQRYDYEDMILWVVKAFQEDASLLQTYQEQYQYFLVDEFQDTNGAQLSILYQLVNYWGDNPNIFVVGDDDQSIYEFQGARVKNMTDFYYKYKQNIALVLLEENYRSSQLILDAARQSIEHNQIRITNQLEEIGIDKILSAANKEVAELNTPVQIVGYPNKLQEEIALIQQIEHLHQKGVAYSEIAIIYAVHKQANNLIRLLDKRVIPYQTKRRVNILDLPIVTNLRKLMQYITLEHQRPYSGEDLFFEFLYYDFVGITPNDAAKLAAWMAKTTQNKLQQQKYSEIPSWRDIIRDKQIISNLDLENPTAITGFGHFLDEAIYNQKNKSILKLFEQIINRSGLMQFVSLHPEKVWYTQVIGTLFEFVRKERSKNTRLDLKGLILLFQQLEENNIPLGIFQVEPEEEGINLVTAHSSKGLEFGYVFIINALKEYWEPKGGNHSRFSLPDTLTFSNESDSYEASRRLFYVAMTRAKKQLQISYFEQNQDGKQLPLSAYTEELLSVPNPAVTHTQKTATKAAEWQLLLLTEQEEVKPTVPLLSKNILKDLLTDFKLSVSALNNYLFCPLGFYFEYVLKVPSFSSKEAAYGTAIHNAIKRVFDIAIKKNEGVLPPIQKLLDLFEFELQKQRVFLSDKIYHERLELGKRQLPLYYAQRQAEWKNEITQDEVSTEKAFKNVVFNNVPLTGTIDKLLIKKNLQQKSIHILDYKTGKLKKERLKSPTKHHTEGGIYWRQLVFYKILVEQSRLFSYPIRSGSIDYLTPDQEGRFPLKTIQFTPDATAHVEQLIEKVYQQIQQHEFSEGCGKKTCKWCDFAQRNLVADSFSSSITEDLDDK